MTITRETPVNEQVTSVLVSRRRVPAVAYVVGTATGVNAAAAPSESWAARACLGSDLVLWYGPVEDGPGSYVEPDAQRLRRERQAIGICATCQVIARCLAAELTLPPADQHGVRGGMTASQRRGLLANQRRERPSAEAQVQRWLACHADGPEAA